MSFSTIPINNSGFDVSEEYINIYNHQNEIEKK